MAVKTGLLTGLPSGKLNLLKYGFKAYSLRKKYLFLNMASISSVVFRKSVYPF
jgi:hypothetical protein